MYCIFSHTSTPLRDCSMYLSAESIILLVRLLTVVLHAAPSASSICCSDALCRIAASYLPQWCFKALQTCSTITLGKIKACVITLTRIQC